MHCMNMFKLISTYALKCYFVMSVPISPSSAASNWLNDDEHATVRIIFNKGDGRFNFR